MIVRTLLTVAVLYAVALAPATGGIACAWRRMLADSPRPIVPPLTPTHLFRVEGLIIRTPLARTLACA